MNLCRLFQPICPEKTVAHPYFLYGRTDMLGGLMGFANVTIVMNFIRRLAFDGLMETVPIVIK